MTPEEIEQKITRMHPEQWHFADVMVRINGVDRRYEGDWIKYVMPVIRAAVEAERERCEQLAREARKDTERLEWMLDEEGSTREDIDTAMEDQ